MKNSSRTSGDATRVRGRVRTSIETGPKELVWRIAAGAEKGAVRKVERGGRRLVVDMPRHRLSTLAAFVAIVGAAAWLVLAGVLSFAQDDAGLPPVGRVVAFLVVALFVAGLGWLMLRDRERLEVDARVIVAERGPLEIVVCRSEISSLTAQEGSDTDVWWLRWFSAVPSLAGLPPEGSDAEPLPLGGFGLTRAEGTWVAEYVNAFMVEVPTDKMFDCRRLDTAPGYVALTTRRDLR